MSNNKSIKINTIPISTIESALATSTPLTPQTDLNTHMHPLTDIQAAIPHLPHRAPDAIQPFVLLSPWLDLIISSQRLDPADCHRIKLPSFYCENLFKAGKTWQVSREVRSSTKEELAGDFPLRTVEGKRMEEVFGSGKKYFVRLDTCNLKDAMELPGKGVWGRDVKVGHLPLISSEQIWQRIVTSERGVEGIDCLGNVGDLVFVYLFPWREEVGKGTEFWVFCPPLLGDLAAISQYKWLEALDLELGSDSEGGRREERLRNWAEELWKGVKEVHGRIMDHPNMTDDLKESGFTFDVAEVDLAPGKDGESSKEVQLVELNPFGAMSGCGSCLFNWVKDARVIYGMEDHVELRLALE
ncbi:hypothetical protein K402DRAFT_457865 [Aulographum hederae CBS 113979]|uniref:Cell division cycle protein 123 n=1 Tax=Aulographum hederae CBS 113979 TaxID=1176131 RepID=A0A6G1GLF0_9PEZI|nr:hypothetical protein K402DRAFT_457865 [Aulographum hederae CBS 113979]